MEKNEKVTTSMVTPLDMLTFLFTRHACLVNASLGKCWLRAKKLPKDLSVPLAWVTPGRARGRAKYHWLGITL